MATTLAPEALQRTRKRGRKLTVQSLYNNVKLATKFSTIKKTIKHVAASCMSRWSTKHSKQKGKVFKLQVDRFGSTIRRVLRYSWNEQSVRKGRARQSTRPHTHTHTSAQSPNKQQQSDIRHCTLAQNCFWTLLWKYSKVSWRPAEKERKKTECSRSDSQQAHYCRNNSNTCHSSCGDLCRIFTCCQVWPTQHLLRETRRRRRWRSYVTGRRPTPWVFWRTSPCSCWVPDSFGSRFSPWLRRGWSSKCISGVSSVGRSHARARCSVLSAVLCRDGEGASPV